MRALDIKLRRDIRRLWAQLLAIALVIASGIALMVMSLGTYNSLRTTAAAYYERYRFADVFASLERAPDRLRDRIADIRGVQSVETRVTASVTVGVSGVNEPVVGRIVSVPDHGPPLLNALAVRSGRMVRPGRQDEVVIAEPFADAHNLRAGDRIDAVLNGTKRKLTIVGTALSPEFVYAIAPGALMPDDRHFAILWMGRKAAAAAFDQEGAFNSVSLSLLRGTNPDGVVTEVDRILARYGGIGATAREDQISNWFVQNELHQLQTMSRILPTIFLAVAAFLTNMVMSRLIATERAEIGLLKAFGYSSSEIAFHYAKLALAIAALGIALGWIAGALLGHYNTTLYNDNFRFPFLFYRPGTEAFAIAAMVSLAAALAGALAAVRRAALLPPAEAMRPPAPPSFNRAGLSALIPASLDQASRIILRQIARTPVRSLLTSTGIAFSVAVLVLALQWQDSLDRMVDAEFHDSQRQDIFLGTREPQSRRALHEFARLPGVIAVEPMRRIAVKFRYGSRSHRGDIKGLPSDCRLDPIYDAASERVVPVPDGGLVLSGRLAKKLGAKVGDRISVEVMEGRREIFDAPVVRLVESYIGMPAWMNEDRLRRQSGTGDELRFANLLVDTAKEAALYAAVKEMPDIAVVGVKRQAIDKFNETVGEIILVFVSFFSVFAGALGFGVTYNSARIALSERGRDLATLRVLGYTRHEISYILIGEVAVLVLAGLGLGCLAGWGLSWLVTVSFDTELFRVPLVVRPATYGIAVSGALASAFVSAAIVHRRIGSIDMIAVLKTRE